MKQLLATARNFWHGIECDGVKPTIEAVLTLYDKQVEFVGAGISSVERTETVRFFLTPAAARNLAKTLNEWANGVEIEATMLTLWPAAQQQPKNLFDNPADDGDSQPPPRCKKKDDESPK